MYIYYNHKKYDEKAQKEGNTRNKNGAKEKRKENAAHGRIPRTRSRKPEAAGQHKQENRDDASGVCVAPVSLLLSVARPAAAPVRFPVPTISASPHPLHASLLTRPPPKIKAAHPPGNQRRERRIP